MTDTRYQEQVFQGIAAAPGIAIGPAYVYRKLAPEIRSEQISPDEVPLEIERLQKAVQRSTRELQKILVFAEQKLGSDSARIFEAQTMILGDAVLMGEIERRIIAEGRNAEFVVADEIAKYKRLMLASELEYMHERAHDLDDVVNRIVRNIHDQRLFSRLEGESIIVSETLTPADTVIFSRNQVLGYATDLGGVTSHAAILSRSLKLPAVVGLRSAMRVVKAGDTVALDGYGGALILHPSEETLARLRQKADRFHQFEAGLTDIVDLDAETRDHRHIELSANVEFPEEVEFTVAQGSAGIGLFRTEGQLLGRTSYPDEEEQFAEYDRVAAEIAPHTVIFRTFDIGGDKLSPEPLQEANPFLGWRGIRLMLDRPEEFRTQLRAILRASTRKNVRLMFPMISTIQESRRARAVLEQAKAELDAAGTDYDHDIKSGVMIEVPSAALLADQFASESDFLSIGTNDLIQYTLAVDRDNTAVAPLYQQFNPAVLRMIKMTIDAGHGRNIWVGMCGEMAGDPLATILLVGMGLDEFSVIPSMLPEIKKIIRSVDIQAARRVAETAFELETAEEIRAYLTGVMQEMLPDIPLES